MPLRHKDYNFVLGFSSKIYGAWDKDLESSTVEQPRLIPPEVGAWLMHTRNISTAKRRNLQDKKDTDIGKAGDAQYTKDAT